MKKKSSRSTVDAKERDPDEIRPEYDAELLRHGVRGKYVQRFREGTNVIVLDPDVAAAFRIRKPSMLHCERSSRLRADSRTANRPRRSA